MPLIYVPSAGTASASGIFIPRDNIAGLIADSELATAEDKIKKDCKFLAGFLTTLQSTITANRAANNSLITALGFTITKGNPTGVESGVFNQTFTASIAQVIDYSTSTFYPIPVPVSGSNSGRGVLKITDVFPDAVSVASAGSIAEAGVLIPHTEVDAYGAAITTNPTNDTQSRQWFAAMLRYLFNEIPIRVNTNPENFSAVITKTLGTVTPFTLAADALASTNPSTGLDPTKVSLIDIYSRSVQFTIEFLLNEQFRRFEVRTSLNLNFTPPIVNITRPSVVEFLNVPTNSANPLDFINIRFSEVINLSSFDFNDISLTRDNGINLINNGVTIEYISETTYQIKGLANLTSTSGVYQLTIDTNGIQNLAGNTGNTSSQTSFDINLIVDLVNNLPPITATVQGQWVRFNQWVRSKFTTGNQSGGYTINSATLRFAAITENPNLFVRLYNDANGSLGSQIGQFINPTFTLNTTANYLFTLNNPQILNPNTNYWLVAGISSGNGDYIWAYTDSTIQSGSLGWTIDDNSSFYTTNQAGIWQIFNGSVNFQFKVTGA